MDVECPGDNDGSDSVDGSLTAVDMGDGWIDTSLTPVSVVVCILECTLSGTTYRSHQQRLLDVLHSSLVANSHRLAKEFVPLTDVDLFFCSGEKEHLKSTHVNKWSVLFVAERSGGQPIRSSLSETKTFAFRPKKPLSARLRIPPYDLVGKMHADPGHALVHVLDGVGMFLPMTDVIITPPLLTGEWQFSFVAVNKHQITRIEEWSGVPQTSAPVAPKVRHRKQRSAKPPKKRTRTSAKSPSSPAAKSKPGNPEHSQRSQMEPN
ncbi:MAG TPA: hypothetical protein VN415_01680 [Dehalococcoidia bacterium]|nr:hypothetical protein [Dehalococcoidia bacterium]